MSPSDQQDGIASDNPPSRKQQMSVLPIDSPRLLPCPFCGSSKIDPQGCAHGNGAEPPVVFTPACEDCGAHAGDAAAWNRRAGTVLPAEMTPEIREVLGLPNFRTGPLAHLYRAAGESIRPNMEEEQAFILFRFLHLALEHGAGWFDASCEDVKAARDAAAAKLPPEARR